MFGGLVKHTVAWAKDNCPRSALLSEEQLRGRVQQAINETYTIRVVVGFVSYGLGTVVMYAVIDAAALDPIRNWRHFWPVALTFAMVTITFTKMDQYLLHRRVRLLLD